MPKTFSRTTESLMADFFHLRLTVADDGKGGESLPEDQAIAPGAEVAEHLVH